WSRGPMALPTNLPLTLLQPYHLDGVLFEYQSSAIGVAQPHAYTYLLFRVQSDCAGGIGNCRPRGGRGPRGTKPGNRSAAPVSAVGQRPACFRDLGTAHRNRRAGLGGLPADR